MWAKKKAVGKPGLANTLLPLQVNEQPRRRPRARPRPPSAPPAGFPMKISPADPQSQTLLVLDSLLASPSPTALLPNSGFGPCDTHSLSAVGGRLGVPGPPLHRQRGTELICFGQSQAHCRPQQAASQGAPSRMRQARSLLTCTLTKGQGEQGAQGSRRAPPCLSASVSLGRLRLGAFLPRHLLRVHFLRISTAERVRKQ